MRSTPTDGTPAACGRPAIDLEVLLGDSDAQFVYEALYHLRAAKAEALAVVQAEGLRPGGRSFEPWDFGIPQIDRLLARIGAEPAEQASTAQER